MNHRIQTLRKKSIQAINTISAERALLLTSFYQSEASNGLSIPLQRASAFHYIMSNKTLCINEGELIVGERGPSPKATPTYPEVCLHTLEDLNVLNNRQKVSFKVDEATRKAFSEIIIPFWEGKTQRERIFSALDDEWKQAYNMGLFTEFQEQRAPGHTVLGNKIYHKGFLDLQQEIKTHINKLDFYHDHNALEKRDELTAMLKASEALILFANRHAQALENLALNEPLPQRREELNKMARICRKVPAHAPDTFHEALQYYWFVHLGVITELNPWDSFNPGRLDQHLYPFFQQEIAAGTLTQEDAKELLQAFWIKFNNHPAPPKVGVTALESNTYTDFALINVGGLKPDGSDATNALSYLILEVVEEMRILQPSSMVQVSKKSPDKLIHRAAQIIKTGFGQPSIFNSDTIVQELVRQGKTVEDARNGGASGCVESGAFGTECYMLTGYFNLPKILEITLHNGIDPRTNKLAGLKTGPASCFTSMDDVMQAFKKQLNHFIDIKIKGNNIIEKLYATYMPAPFLSLLIDDCIAKGTDYNAGGARYNSSYIQGVGIGSIADMLTAIEYHLFDKKTMAWDTLNKAMQNNFEDFDTLRTRLIYETPKYGNDNDYADKHAVNVFNMFFDAVDDRETARGGQFRINMLPTTCHVYFGSIMGASPDGRLRGEPLSEGISPFQGADINGPTAVIKSAAKLDHIKTGGTLLNQKFAPSFFDTTEGITRLSQLVRSYFKLDGHHIQFNVIAADTLRKAQKEPEKYKDLIVRVAGYSDYFNDLGDDLQNEIIRRTEHEGI